MGTLPAITIPPLSWAQHSCLPPPNGPQLESRHISINVNTTRESFGWRSANNVALMWHGGVRGPAKIGTRRFCSGGGTLVALSGRALADWPAL